MAKTVKNSQTKRILTVILLLVCAVMLGRLVLTVAGVWGTPSNTAPSAPAASGASAASSGPSAATPGPAATGANAAVLHLDELAQLNGRPLPDFERNPFQYGPTPEEVKAQHDAETRAANPTPPQPPPPPPVPFMAIGYQTSAAGQRLAYLCTSGGAGGSPGGAAPGGHCAEDQEPYAVRDGQEFGQHFKVLRITDSMVEVEDESYHQTVQLPFPQ